MSETRFKVGDLMEERDALKEERDEARAERDALRVDLAEMRDERNKALAKLGLVEESQPTYPSVLMQDRLDKSGPYVVLGAKDFDGVSSSLVYWGANAAEERLEGLGGKWINKTGAHWRWTASLEPYSPPPPEPEPEPTPEERGWDRATLARMALAAFCLVGPTGLFCALRAGGVL